MKIIGFISEDGDAPAGISFPDSCLIHNGKPLFIPDFDTDFRLYPSLAVKITKVGKCIEPRFAHRYYEKAAPAINVRAMGVLDELRKKGLPWTRAVSFDGSIILGEFTRDDSDPGLLQGFSIICGESEANWRPSKEFSINEAISAASEFRTLKTGDIIICPFSKEFIAGEIGTHVEILNLEKDCIGRFNVR